MNFRRFAAATFGVLLAGAALAAQTPDPGTQTATPRREKRAEQRATNQQKRIAQGVASGQLTPRETARLERQEARVNKDITKAEADGKISKKEAGKIQREQNRESRRIKRQKHDAQTTK
jgi:predicted transglutaminase-like cysteine proteinase